MREHVLLKEMSCTQTWRSGGWLPGWEGGSLLSWEGGEWEVGEGEVGQAEQRRWAGMHLLHSGFWGRQARMDVLSQEDTWQAAA